jgi:hypothetical protein
MEPKVISEGSMPLKIIAGSIFMVWLALVIAGKGGFVHLLLFNALGVAFVEVLRMYRTNLHVRDEAEDRTLHPPAAS